jgi:uncharacterized protein (DUF302 family)
MQCGDGVSIELGPTGLLVLGNPKPGSHFFSGRQTADIELPMKALALEDTGDKCGQPAMIRSMFPTVKASPTAL